MTAPLVLRTATRSPANSTSAALSARVTQPALSGPSLTMTAPLVLRTATRSPGEDLTDTVLQPSNTFEPGPRLIAYTHTAFRPRLLVLKVLSKPWFAPTPLKVLATSLRFLLAAPRL